jgi:hypothetical protein
MKIKCIQNKNRQKYLTIGKTYNVIKEFDICYYITNDVDYNMWFVKTRFKPAVAEIRNEKINKLLK